MLFGFGTAMNWDIAAARRVRQLVLADRSVDVLLAHESLYRPIFLASETPEEFLAFLSGQTVGGDGVRALLDRALKTTVADESAIRTLEAKLIRLEAEGKLTATDRQFCLAAVRDQPTEQSPLPFKNICLKLPLAKAFCSLYAPWSVAHAVQMDPGIVTQSGHGFLADLASFSHVRDLYLSDAVRFALADLFEPTLYDEATSRIQSTGAPLTDVYLTNIPSTLAKEGKRWDAERFFRLLAKPLSAAKSPKLFIYETAGLDVPHEFFLHEIDRG